MDEALEIKELLERWRAGEHDALDKLVPMVYAELRRLAHLRLRMERPGHTLDTTALVHEAYIRMTERERLDLQNRTHFLAVAAKTMRQVLVDYARSRGAQKRGSGVQHERMDPDTEERLIPEDYADSILELDDVLSRLEELHPRCSQIIEQRFFGGLTLEETAEFLGISTSSVKRDFRFARAWLARELSSDFPLADPSGKSS